MKFAKMHGAGNDFVVLETDDTTRDWAQTAIAVCDRHFGIGSDGLLLVLPSQKADCRMRMFDPDGSEAEACGNGIRCVARYASEAGLVSAGSSQVLIETVAGVRKVKLFKEGSKLVKFQAGMGRPVFEAGKIPVAVEKDKGRTVYIKSMPGHTISIDGTELPLNFVSMGNPHAVYFSPQPVAEFPLPYLGPKVEEFPIFPRRTNFEVARVLNQREIEVRVWERGAGETLACGSGACAVAVAAQLCGYTGNKVDLKLPGGVLQVEWDGSGEVLLSGPAEKVFEGEWTE